MRAALVTNRATDSSNTVASRSVIKLESFDLQTAVGFGPRVVMLPTFSGELISVIAYPGHGSIHYTLDGTEPTESFPLYSSETLQLTPGQTLKARVIYPTGKPSAVATYDQQIAQER